MRADVGLGDLLRAWDAFGRDPAVLPALAGTFGVAVEARITGEGAGNDTQRSAVPRTRGPLKPPPGQAPAETFESHGLVTTLETLPASTPPPPPSWLAVSALPRSESDVTPPPPPLFSPERERALLAAICRTLRPEGDIDVERTVDGISRLQLPRVLPRLRIPSMSGGLQVLIDQSRWMAPHRTDLACLAIRLREVVGDLMQHLVVSELPPAVRAPHEDEARPWEPPRAGTAIVIVSDLGRAALRDKKRAPRRAWVSFVGRMRASGFAPMVIVPGRTASYLDVDRELKHTLLLGWDRRTRIAEASRFRKERVR